MKQILVLGRRHADPGFALSKPLAHDVQKYLPAGFTATGACLQDIEILAAPGAVSVVHEGRDLADYDAVFLHGWFAQWKDEVLAIASYLAKRNVPFLNSEAAKQRSSGKVSQAVMFGLAGLSAPRTFFKADMDDVALDRCITAIGLPLILKQANGNKGKNNFLIQTREQLASTIAQHKEVRFIAQQFIPNAGDVRVILYQGEPLMVLARHNDHGGHLHNVSQGGQAELGILSDLPTDIVKDCATASGLMHRELSGMDIVQSTKDDRWYILESNNMPQLTSGAYANEKAALLAGVLAKIAR